MAITLFNDISCKLKKKDCQLRIFNPFLQWNVLNKAFMS